MKNGKKATNQEAEVDELLKSVEDEMLLKLSLNSHISHVAPDYLPSDLDRRFRALKKPQPSSSSSSSPLSPSPIPTNPRPAPSAADPPEIDAVLGADLTARFAALRASLPAQPPATDPAAGWDEEDDDDEDAQVEKLIRWAKDAARLDPSPPSDDDLDDDDYDEDDCPPPVK